MDWKQRALEQAALIIQLQSRIIELRFIPDAVSPRVDAWVGTKNIFAALVLVTTWIFLNFPLEFGLKIVFSDRIIRIEQG